MTDGRHEWSDKKIDTAEKYLDRMLAKLESAKTDVEKNWLAQITSIAISLALVAGLGTAMAQKLLGDAQHSNLLYVVFPVVNTYLFVRFGLIGGVFSKARYNAEQLAVEISRHIDLPATFDPRQIYKTNSYFEWAHQPFSRVTIPFLLTIPLIFGLNHALTLYLLYKVLGLSSAYWMVVGFYAVIVGTCYGAYYFSNKANTVVFVGSGRNSFIVIVIGIAAVATAAMLWALAHFDPDPGPIDFTGQPPVTSTGGEGR